MIRKPNEALLRGAKEGISQARATLRKDLPEKMPSNVKSAAF
jgi:hypothetical protein